MPDTSAIFTKAVNDIFSRLGEEVVYTPKGGDPIQVLAQVDRGQNLEPYIRGDEMATCFISVRASDVPNPQYGDTFTITNPGGIEEVWELDRVEDSDLITHGISLRRRE